MVFWMLALMLLLNEGKFIAVHFPFGTTHVNVNQDVDDSQGKTRFFWCPTTCTHVKHQLQCRKYNHVVIIAESFNFRIQVNDQIIEVDGISLVGVTQQFAAQTLKNTSGIVRLGKSKFVFIIATVKANILNNIFIYVQYMYMWHFGMWVEQTLVVFHLPKNNRNFSQNVK